MTPHLNRLCTPADWTPTGPTAPHALVTPAILEGQHPIRAWEYAQALRALERGGWDFAEHKTLRFLDVGGAGSRFHRCLLAYTGHRVTRVDPAEPKWHEDTGSIVIPLPLTGYRAFLDTLRGKGDPPKTFDAVFCLSVIEHVPPAAVGLFLDDLCALVGPDGLLVLTCDIGPQQPDNFHFHWMRQWIPTPETLKALVEDLDARGLTPLDAPDFAWHGPTLYDYSVAALALEKDASHG